MTRSADELLRARDLIDQLLALDGEFWAKRAEYRRGGLPAGGSTGRSSHDGSPMLQSDQTDKAIHADGVALVAALVRAGNDLAGALRIVTRWAATVPPLPEPTAAPCQRLTCDVEVSNVGSDRLRKSPLDALKVCPACYMHERRTGQVRRVA